jgi:hypothetical protein
MNQPVGLCENCLKRAEDPALNCPIAQAIRESGVLAHVIECKVLLPMEKGRQCERATLVMR